MMANIGDIFGTWHAEIEKWFCVQVINKNDDGYLTLIILDGFYDDIPSEDALAPLNYLNKDHHNFKGEPMIENVSPGEVPESYHHIAKKPPIFEEELFVYNGAWPKNHDQVTRQYRWNELPKDLTAQYKTAKLSDGTVTLGGFEFRMRATRVNINTHKSELDFNSLSALPALTDLHLFTQTVDPAPFLRHSPLIATLEMSQHGRSEIDISGTKVQKFTVDVSGLKRLVLNDYIRDLFLTGDLSSLKNLKVIHPKNGKWLQIHIISDVKFDVPNFLLPELHALRLKVHQADFSRLSKFYPKLSSLKIWGQPGHAINVNHLANFTALEAFWLFDMFEFSADDFPAATSLTSLSNMWLSSIPKDVGVYAKKNFAHIRSLDIDKLRSEKWLKENIDNPFRSWDGRSGISKANAKKAFNSFKALNSAVEKSKTGAPLIAAFDKFIDVFNSIESKKGGIDTLEREEIYVVYMDLARQTDISEKDLFERFEARRLA